MKRIVSAVLACLLTFMAVPAVAAEPTVGESASATVGSGEGARTIDDLLAAGDYAQGEAVVVVDSTAAAPRSRSMSPLDGAEPLMSLSADTYAQAVDSSFSAEGSVQDSAGMLARSARSGQSSDELSIVLVRNDAMSTEDLLLALADDPRVVSAEPNYTTYLLDDAAAQATSAVAQAVSDAQGSPDLSSYASV